MITKELARMLEYFTQKNRKVIVAYGLFNQELKNPVEYAMFLNILDLHGEFIIVVTPSDEIMTKHYLKENEPLIPFTSREMVLRSHVCVDYVVKQEDETPDKLLYYIKPNLYFPYCGYWRPEMDETYLNTVPGYKVAQACGSKCILLEPCTDDTVVLELEALSEDSLDMIALSDIIDSDTLG